MPDITQADPAAIAEAVTECWEDWSSERRPTEKKWDECVKNYLVELDTSKYEDFPWRSRIADNFSQETADTLASQMRGALFPVNDDYFSLTGEDDLGKQHVAPMTGYVKSMLNKAKLVQACLPWLKQIAVIGNAPYQLAYETLNAAYTRRVRTVDPVTGKYGVKIVPNGSKTWEGPKFACLDAYDVVFDHDCVSVDESPIIRRMKVDREELSTIRPQLDLSALEDIKAGSAPGEPSDTHKRVRDRIFGIQEGGEDSDECELLWYYGDLWIEGDCYTDVRVVVANRTAVVLREANPFWAGRPIGWGGYDPMWNTGLSKGALDPVRGVQLLINTFQNQKADILSLMINGAFAYVDDGVIDPDRLFLSPMGAIPVGNINNLKPLQPSSNVALSYSEIEQLRARGERSTGVSRFDQGQAPGGRRTAFEANMIRAGGSARTNDTVRQLANGPLEHVVNFAVHTLQQFKFGQREIPDDVLLGEYTAQFTGGDNSMLRQMEKESLLLAAQVAAQSPEAAAAVNMPVLWTKLFRNLGQNDPDLVADQATYEKRLAEMAQRAKGSQPTPPGEEGPVGGADESLRSLLGRLEA